MNRWQLDWGEYRETEDWRELIFVEATEEPKGWVFISRSTYDVRWQDVQPDMRLVLAAECFKKALNQNRPVTGSIVYALQTEHSGLAAIQIVDDIGPILKEKRALGNQCVLAEMRLSSAKRLEMPLAEQRPGAARAA
jgi:hypothetical protein